MMGTTADLNHKTTGEPGTILPDVAFLKIFTQILSKASESIFKMHFLQIMFVA